MRIYGFFLFLIGGIVLFSFWSYYFSSLSNIGGQSDFIRFVILFIGMIISIFSGIIITLGIKTIINPRFLSYIIDLIKENSGSDKNN